MGEDKTVILAVAKMLQKIIIKDVVNDRETTFQFPARGMMPNIGNLNVSIGDVLKSCRTVWPDLNQENCFVVCDGCVQSPNEQLIVMDTTSASASASAPSNQSIKVIYIYETIHRVCDVGQCFIDEVSMQAARNWISEPSACTSAPITAQLALTLQGKLIGYKYFKTNS